MLKKYGRLIGLSSIIILTLVKISCFHQQGNIPLGYDPGIYRGISLAYTYLIDHHLSLTHLPMRIRHEPLRGIMSALLAKIGIAIDRQLGIGRILVTSGVMLMTLMRKKDRTTIGLTLFLIGCSVIQYQAFALMYYKQILGIGISIGIIALLERYNFFVSGVTETTKQHLTRGAVHNRKQRIPVLVLCTILITLHRHASLYLYGSLGIYIIRSTIRAKKIIHRRLISIMTLAGCIGLAFYGPLLPRLVGKFIEPLASTIAGDGIKGTFMPRSDFFQYNFLLVLIACTGSIWHIRRKKTPTIDIASLCFGLLWTLGGLLNYRRGLIFFDISIICVAATTLMQWRLTSIARLRRIIAHSCIGIVCLLQASFALGYISTYHTPDISPALLQNIRDIAELTPSNALIMTTESQLAPWVLGYSKRARRSPGLSDANKRDLTVRNNRRNSHKDIKCMMLDNAQSTLQGRPLYLWQVKTQRDYIGPGACFVMVQDMGESVLVEYKGSDQNK